MRKPVDEAIDQALASLRGAEPSASMQARILDSLRYQESRPRSVRSLRWLCISAAGSIAALVLVAMLLHAPGHSPTSAALYQPPSNSLPKLAAAPAAVQSRPHFAPRRSAGQSRTSRASNPAQLTSFPAPEAPLTEQERLLLRVAHRGDRQDFELLNPETIERELAENMADFDRFFPPPPPIPIDTPDVPNQGEPNEAHPMDR